MRTRLRMRTRRIQLKYHHIIVAVQMASLGNPSASSTEKSCTEIADEMDSWLEGIFSQLGWTREHLEKDEDKVVCPNDSNHCIPESALSRHLEYCRWLKQGYSRKELDDASTSKFYYKKSSTVVPVNIDNATLNIILGTATPNWQQQQQQGGSSRGDREFAATVEKDESQFSSKERRLIYDYCVQTAKAANRQISIPTEQLMLLEQTQKDESGRRLSGLELKAMERDMKRRRQSYRGKNVHTGKKSHTEVIQEVIENQMELLGIKWQEEAKGKRREAKESLKERREENREQKRTRDRSGYRSRSRSPRSSTHRSRSRSPRSSLHRSRSRSPRSSLHRSRSRSPKSSHGKRSRSRSPRTSHKKHKRSRSRSKERRKHHKKSKHHKSSRNPAKALKSEESANQQQETVKQESDI